MPFSVPDDAASAPIKQAAGALPDGATEHERNKIIKSYETVKLM
jgi:hypothetical protein